ncbi:MAG: type II secretion system F family protein [Gaiellaceae bacterium]
MRRLAWVVAAVAAVLAAGPASAGVTIHSVDTTSYPTIRVTVVTGHPVKHAPALREGGTPLQGVQATNLGSAKSVVLAIDRSRSMVGQPLADAIDGAQAFVAAMRPSDRVAVITVGRRPAQVVEFAPASEVQNALRNIRVEPVEGTALWDGAMLGARMLRGEQGKGRALVLLTDGNNTKSTATVQAAADAARAAGAIVYVIGIEGPQFAPGPLRELAQDTGGSYVGAHTSRDLRGAYAAVATALRRTWRFEYATALRPGEKTKLAAAADGGVASETLTVGGTTSSGPSSSLPAPLLDNPLSTLALAIGVGVIVLLAVTAIFAASEGGRLQRRLKPHLGEAPRRRATEQKSRSVLLSNLFRATEDVFSGARVWQALQRMLERADVPLRTVEFAYIIGGAALAGCVLALIILGSPLLALLGLLAGGAAPVGWLYMKAKRRERLFEDQLPDLLVALAATLKAGHSFRQALKTVADEGRPPASKELNRVLTEARLGRPMEAALAEMSERVGSKNFEFVITSVTIQRQVGGSLAGLIDMVADTVRARQQFARKIKGLTAMGRASAYVLIALPFFMAAGITVINAGYMRPLYFTSTGHKLIVIGLIMMVFGTVVMRRIVAFKG